MNQQYTKWILELSNQEYNGDMDELNTEIESYLNEMR